MTTVVERFRAMRVEHPVAGRLRLCNGCMEDYAALARHHCPSGRPATVTRVLVARDEGRGVVERFWELGCGMRQGTAALKRHRFGEEGNVVGVLVESMPKLPCAMREAALGERYGWLPAAEGVKVLNEEVRCISRVVVDARYWGLGVAVRLVRHALETAMTPVTEAIAAMGHASLFFERAGMTPYRREAHAFDARLRAALKVVGIEREELVFLNRAWAKVETLPEVEREWLLAELKRWYWHTQGRPHDYERDPRAQLRAARERLWMEPVYYVKVRDEGEFERGC